MKNIEIKVRLGAGIDISEKIRKSGAVFFGLLNQEDIYYKHDAGLLKLRIYGENAELIFYKRDETASKRESEYNILKLEPVSRYFLERIFETEAVVNKTRELWIYKNTRIHLDKVEKLGDFLELETVTGDEEPQFYEKQFKEVYDLLRLRDFEELRLSYRDLIISTGEIAK